MTPEKNSNELPEPTRRELLKAAAGAGTVAAVGAPSFDPVAADDDGGDIEDILVKSSTYGPVTNATATAFQFGADLASKWEDEPGKEPQIGNVNFHQTMTSASTWWGVAETFIENTIKNATMVAHIQARNAVADAYESGKTESEASQDVIDAVDEYISIPWFNTWASANAALLQTAYIVDTALQADDSKIDTGWRYIWTPPDADYSGSGSLVGDKSQIQPETAEVSITPPDGETRTYTGVVFAAEWDNGDTFSQAFGDEFRSAYDPDTQLFTFTTDQGNTLEHKFGPIQGESVPEDGLETSPNLFSGDGLPVVMKHLKSLEDAAQTVKDNYPLSFIGDLYAAMDLGQIDPADVRGVEAYAQLLSGSTDVTNSRYQTALSTLTGASRSDLSQTSGMVVTINGYTETEPVTHDGGRDLRPTSYIQDAVLSGMLFASDVPDTISTGKTYNVDPFVVGYDGSDLKLSDYGTAAYWSSTPASSISDIYMNRQQNRVIAASGSDLLWFDTTDGTKVNQETISNIGSIDAFTYIEEDEKYLLANGNSLTCVDADYNQLWESSIFPDHDETADLAYSNGKVTVVGRDDGNFGYVTFDVSDGSEIYRTNAAWIWGSKSGSHGLDRHGDKFVWSVASSQDNANKCWLIDDSDGTPTNLGAPQTDYRDSVAAAIGENYALVSSDEMHFLDTSDGTVVSSRGSWATASTNIPGSDLFLVAHPNETRLYDPTTANVVDSSDALDGCTEIVHQGYDNHFAGARFHAAMDESFNELQLSGAQITVEEMVDNENNQVSSINTQDWGPPDFDIVDTSDYADYLDKVAEEFGDALNTEVYPDDGSASGGGTSGDCGLPGPVSFLCPVVNALASIPGIGVGAAKAFVGAIAGLVGIFGGLRLLDVLGN